MQSSDIPDVGLSYFVQPRLSDKEHIRSDGLNLNFPAQNKVSVHFLLAIVISIILHYAALYFISFSKNILIVDKLRLNDGNVVFSVILRRNRTSLGKRRSEDDYSFSMKENLSTAALIEKKQNITSGPVEEDINNLSVKKLIVVDDPAKQLPNKENYSETYLDWRGYLKSNSKQTEKQFISKHQPAIEPANDSVIFDPRLREKLQNINIHEHRSIQSNESYTYKDNSGSETFVKGDVCFKIFNNIDNPSVKNDLCLLAALG